MEAAKDFSHALSRYQKSLEELTFNSKPLIDDLTRAAETCKVVAKDVIKLIKKHIMKVASWRKKNFKKSSSVVYSHFCIHLHNCMVIVMTFISYERKGIAEVEVEGWVLCVCLCLGSI